jgi:hypothetical protein
MSDVNSAANAKANCPDLTAQAAIETRDGRPRAPVARPMAESPSNKMRAGNYSAMPHRIFGSEKFYIRLDKLLPSTR